MGIRAIGGMVGVALSCCVMALAASPAAASSAVRVAGPGSLRARTESRLREDLAHWQAAGRRDAHAAIVAGTTLLSPDQTPWTVFIFAEDEFGQAWSCDGVVLDATHILTAGHCLYDSAGDVASPDDYVVFFDIANFNDITASTPASLVSAVRPDPSYDPSDTTSAAGEFDAYDIGVLELSSPLSFGAGGSAPQPLAFGAQADAAQATSLSVAGFGDETPGAVNGVTVPDGSLNQLTFTPFAPGTCAGDVDALVGCASSPVGAICYGDSGSAITTTGPTPVLLGVVDAGGPVGDQYCEPTAELYYAKVTTPELSDFIEGLPIVAAPQGGDGVDCSVPFPFAPGGTLQCGAGSWTGSPTYTYTFVDDTSGAVLQTGSSPNFTLTDATVGHQLYLLVTASNPGGSGVARTVDSPVVQPGGPINVTTTSSTTTATSSASVGDSTTTATSTTSTLTAQLPAAVRPKLRLSAASSRVRPGAKDAIRAVWSSGTSALVRGRLCVTVPSHTSIAQASGATIHGREACWTKSLRARASVTLTLQERVASGARSGELVTSATAGGGLVASVRVSVS